MGIIIDDPRLRERRFVFTDRHDAGRQLGDLIRTLPGVRDSLVFAISAGGVPVGVEVARALGAPVALAVVRKIQVPGNAEAGFGAVIWDGHVLINTVLQKALGLTEEEIGIATEKARENVQDRITRFRAGTKLLDPAGKTCILTDDGLASGFTMLAALESLRNLHPAQIIVAVPTASAGSAEIVSREVDKLICLNIRPGPRFAVAEAYKRWYDLSDGQVIAELSLPVPGRPMTSPADPPEPGSGSFRGIR